MLSKRADGTADGTEAAGRAGRLASACGEQCAAEAHARGLTRAPTERGWLDKLLTMDVVITPYIALCLQFILQLLDFQEGKL